MAASRWLALATLVIFSASAYAEDHATQVWLNPGVLTHHFKEGNFREDNYGIGAEVVIAPEHALLAGTFINSDRERSHYAGYYWRPWEWKPGGVSVKPGLVLALFDGYSNTNHGHWFPAAFPSVSAEYGIYGANVALVTNPKNGAALALQLKLRVW